MCNYKSGWFEYNRKLVRFVTCQEPSFAGDPEGLCIFHSKSGWDKKPFFQKRLEEYTAKQPLQIELEDNQGIKIFLSETVYNYIGFNFPYGFSFCKKEFESDAIFAYADFEEKVNFTGAKFKGKANFYGAIFEERAEFCSAMFAGNNDFRSTTFGGKANFNKARFGQNTNFLKATFGENTTFSDARLGKKKIQ